MRIFAGEDPLSMIRESYPAEAISSLLPGRPTAWPSLLRRRVRAGIEAVEKDVPLAVISDGDLPGLLAAKRCGIPSIAVGRAEVFSETARPPCAPVMPWVREMFSAKVSSLNRDTARSGQLRRCRAEESTHPHGRTGSGDDRKT